MVSEFEDSLVYRASFRSARETENTSMKQHVSDKHPFVGSGKVTFRALVDLLMSVHLANVVLVGYWVEGGKGAEGAP